MSADETKELVQGLEEETVEIVADYLLSRAAGKVLENLRDDIAAQVVSKLETLQVGVATRGSRKKQGLAKGGPHFLFQGGQLQSLLCLGKPKGSCSEYRNSARGLQKEAMRCNKGNLDGTPRCSEQTHIFLTTSTTPVSRAHSNRISSPDGRKWIGFQFVHQRHVRQHGALHHHGVGAPEDESRRAGCPARPCRASSRTWPRRPWTCETRRLCQ